MCDCRCEMERRMTWSRYMNIIEHMRADHPKDWAEFKTGMELEPASYQLSSKSLSLLWKHSILHIIRCMRKVVKFATFQRFQTRRACQSLETYPKTVINYLGPLNNHLKRQISNVIQNRFAAVFEKWSNEGTHLVSIFLSLSVYYHKDSNCKFVEFPPLKK